MANKQDFNTNLTDTPTRDFIDCSGCGGKAVFTVTRVHVPGETPTVISSIVCDVCNINDNAIYDGDTGKGRGVNIKCKFSSPEDLQRYIRVSENSRFDITKNGHSFSYVSGTSGIIVVESVLRDLIKNYGEVFDIKTHSESSVAMDSESSMQSAMSTVDEKEIEKRVKLLELALKDGEFEMHVTDDMGLSRVGPVDVMLKDVSGDGLKMFNDTKVHHSYYSVKKAKKISNN